MIRKGSLIAIVILLLASAPVLAGGDHCKGNPEDCVKKLHQKLSAKGWLGVEMEKTDAGLPRVTAVVPGSPAEVAGFRPGDVLVALNGVELGSGHEAKLKQVKHSLGQGSQVRYTVARDGGKVELTAVLGQMPRELIAQAIGEHMMTKHLQVQVASK